MTEYSNQQEPANQYSRDVIRKGDELVAMFRECSKPDVRTDNTYWSSILCAIILCNEMITIQGDFYGLVFTTEFRDRINRKVEFLEQVKSYLQSLK